MILTFITTSAYRCIHLNLFLQREYIGEEHVFFNSCISDAQQSLWDKFVWILELKPSDFNHLANQIDEKEGYFRPTPAPTLLKKVITVTYAQKQFFKNHFY